MGALDFCSSLLAAAELGKERNDLPNDNPQLPPGPTPGYSQGLEFTIALLLRSMAPAQKLALARRMIEVFKFVEASALDELGGG
jgi:hypothetical protein